jgi:hypothetical protein
VCEERESERERMSKEEKGMETNGQVGSESNNKFETQKRGREEV